MQPVHVLKGFLASWLVLVTASVVLLVGCRATTPSVTPTTPPAAQPSATATPQATPPPSPTTVPTPVGARGGTLSYAIQEDMRSFDLQDLGTSYADIQPVAPLFNGLVSYNMYDYPSIESDLAERWELGQGDTTITFFLRRGVTFHDGSPFACRDAAYSLQKLVDPKRSSMAGNFAIQDVRCTGDYTLEVRLARPQAAILPLLASSRSIIVKEGWAQGHDQKDVAFAVGTGPFRLKSRLPGVAIEAERNPTYWKKGRDGGQLPYLDGVRTLVVPDPTTIFANFRTGQLTLTGIGRNLTKSDAEALKAQYPDAVVALGPRSAWDNFVMNVRKPPFDNPKVRLAVALATDRQKMVQIAAEGWGTVGGYMMPHMPFALPQTELTQFPQFGADMEGRRAQARALLEGAGYGGGLTVEYLVRKGEPYQSAAVSRQDDLKKVGINLDLRVLDAGTMYNRAFSQDFISYTLAAAATVDDPDQVYAFFLCSSPPRQNVGGYCNPKVDELYGQQSASFDPQRRVQLNREIEKLLLADIPEDRGYFWWSAMAYWGRVQNWVQVTGVTVYSFSRLEQVWCREGRCQ
ncbi:MAG: ABC transporter substrate-binding protein [Chloroflexi bacterium]|nr:ABC transporter substrate-binding protein [Chloroflexota bacterium]